MAPDRPLIPPALPGGRPRTADVRECLNAIFSVTRAGGDWRMLPHDLLPWGTSYAYFRRRQDDGTWETIHDIPPGGHPREQVRGAAIIASQSVQTTEKGATRLRGGEEDQRTQARVPSGQSLVDTARLLLAVRVHPANLPDRDAAYAVLALLVSRFPRLAHLWADAGYAGKLAAWVQAQWDWTVEIVKKPSRWVLVPTGFQVLKRR